MTKHDLVEAMTSQAGGYFITKTGLAKFIGNKRTDAVGKYVADLPVLNKRYYFIPDVAERMMADTKKAAATKGRRLT